MRIHWLSVRDVKGVARARVDFPDTGVVVIQGPNEVGKSTLLEAFDRLLDGSCKASSKAGAVRDLQPVGVDAGPFVEAEISVGPYRVVFAKQWLRQPSTTLRVMAPTPEQLSGDAAQARMTAILGECLDRPLFDALRFAQGGDAGAIPLGSSQVLAQALDAAAGADLHSEGGDDLLTRVDAEYRSYFTAGGRPTGDYRAAITATQRAQDDVVRAHAVLAEADRLLAERESALQALQVAQAAGPGLEEALARAQTQHEQAAGVLERERCAAQAVSTAQETVGRAQADHDDRLRRVHEVGERQERVQAMSVEAEHRRARVAPLMTARQAAELAWADAVAALTRARALAERAGADAGHLAEAAERDDLRGRLTQAERLGEELRQAQLSLDDARVTPAVLDRIVQASSAVDVAQAGVEATATVLTLESLGPALTVEVDGQPVGLSFGMVPMEHMVSQQSEIVLPGSLRVTVRPQGDAAALADRLEQARQLLTQRLAEAGVADVQAARGACEEHLAASAQCTTLSTELSGALGGRSCEGLTSRLSQVEESSAAYLSERGDDEGLPADAQQAKAVHRAAHALVQEQQRELSEVEQRRDASREACTDAHRRLEVGLARLEGDQGALAREQQQLADARGQRADEELGQAAQQAAQAAAAADLALAQAGAAVARAGAAEAEVAVRQGSRELEQHRLRAAELRDRANQLKGRVETAASEGRQEAYDGALHAFAESRAGLLSIDRRARAARQLHVTLQRHRAQAHETYVRPFAEAVQRVGAQVYGDTFGVVVSPDLVLTHRHLHGTTVPFHSLSGGAKEQLGILARLAVSSMLDAEQGVPVVIDDALGYTDPQRLQQVGEVLGAPTASAQVILLTCSPDRYAAVPGATLITLTA